MQSQSTYLFLVFMDHKMFDQKHRSLYNANPLNPFLLTVAMLPIMLLLLQVISLVTGSTPTLERT